MNAYISFLCIAFSDEEDVLFNYDLRIIYLDEACDVRIGCASLRVRVSWRAIILTYH